MVIKNSLNQSHDIIKKIINEGDVVVDATAGNGNDTLLLAELVGEKGRVYAFDIQQDAINNTIKKLQDNNLASRVTVIEDGHQNMDKYINENIKAVMFNLGYLPGGNHNIATKGETTIAAVKKAMDLLVTGGIITIVIYYGGDSGFDEKKALLDFLSKIDNKKYVVMKTEFINQPNCPPILVCIEKINIANK